MREDLPAGVASFLLTDIEGSTRLLEQLGAEAYAEALSQHRTLLRDAFARHGGVEVDNQGDAFFIAFETAIACVRGAVDAQRALAGHNWNDHEPIRVRMGMHAGPAQRTDEGYVGMAVHTAARITSAGHGGQILISNEVAQAVQAVLPDLGLTLRDLGEHQLKDVDGLQNLFQIVIPELPSDFSAPRSLVTRPNNLPTPTTPFIGRAQLVSQVRDTVLKDDVRLVTLVGPGGTGKSRLGLRVATELLHHFEDGTFFIPLASLKDPDLVPAKIAATLDIREADNKPITDCIAEALADKTMLLLIDNSEQVQAAAKHIGAVLSACPGVKAVVTSREALRLSGATTVRVPPFELPDPDRLPPLEELRQNESVRLFVERARAVREDFELSEANAPDVVAICRRVDALPLAIELAASRVRSMNPDRLLRALERRFKVLTGGADDLLDHQKSLRELIAWSYDLLDASEQKLWRRLAVFVGGCTVDAAQDVCDPDDEFVMEVDVESLIDKSLVNLRRGEAGGVNKLLTKEAEPRLVMLDTLREYAFERLAESGESDVLHSRCSDWCVALAERAEAEFRGPNLEVWAERLDQEQDNFRGALEYCLDAPAGATSALRIAAALWYFWYERGYLSEACGWLDKSLAQDASTDERVRGHALVGSSGIARQQNRLEDAQRHGQAALSLYRRIGDDGGIADALNQLGAIAQRQGDNRTAAICLDEALDLLRPLSDHKDRLSFALVARGVIDHLEGDLDEARKNYAEALDVGSVLGDKNSIATALVNLGEIAEAQGELDRAYDYYCDSLRLNRELGYKLAIAYGMEVLAGLDANHLGRPEKAALLFGAAAALREQIAAPIEPFNAERLARDTEHTRKALGEAAFDAAMRGGAEHTVNEIIDQVLG